MNKTSIEPQNLNRIGLTWLNKHRKVGTIVVLALGLVPVVLADVVSSGSAQPEHKFVTRYAYYDDAVLTGLVKTRTDPAGRMATYNYDSKRRLTRIAYADDKTVEYTYDKFGRRMAMKDWTGTSTYEYDTLNRLTKATQSNGLWVRFEYDWMNRTTAIIIPGDPPNVEAGWRVDYVYDFLGRLSSINSPVGKFVWQYDYAKGTVRRRMPNGVVTTFSYRPDGLLESIRHEREDGAPEAGKRALLIGFAYEYQPDGKVSAETVTHADGRKETTRYRYDKVERLVEVALPDAKKIIYTYDAMGNRLSQSGPNGEIKYAYDQWDQIQQAGAETFGHDLAGNIVWRRDQKGRTVYEYDNQNRLTAARTSTGDVTYNYDANGLLITRTTSHQRTDYVVVPSVKEIIPLAAFSGRRPIGRAIVTDRLLCSAYRGAGEFVLEDRLLSVRATTDEKGHFRQAASGGAWGIPRASAGQSELRSSFVGLPHDPLLSMMLAGARVYDPVTGRFMQRDPIHHWDGGLPRNCNAYVYCHSDPLNFVDRDGLTEKNAQAFYDYINDVPAELSGFRFDYAAGVGFGSGTESSVEIAKTFAGSVQAVYVWGNKGGFPEDMAVAIFDSAGGARSGGNLVPIPTDTFVPHSASNFLQPRDVQHLYPQDPAAYKREQPDIDRPGIISDLTGVDLGKPLEHGVVGLAFTGSTPLEAGGDMLRAGRGIVQLAWRTIVSPFTGQGPLADHALPPMLDRLEQQGKIPEKATYDTLHVFRRDGSGVWHDEVLKQDLKVVHQGTTFSLSGSGEWGATGPPTASPSVGGLETAPTKIGGVRLDKAAKVLGDIGQISAVTYDPKTKRLVLVGEKRTALPAVRLDDLAVVMRCIYVEGIDPWLSIDPKEGDLYGPKMKVVYSIGLTNTHAGRVMYETDYKLKEYAAGGRGNRKLTSKVAAWKCVDDLEKELFPTGREKDQDIWYRFWLKPADITIKFSEEDQSLVFDRAKVMVETENMLLQEGQLVRVKNVKDPVAERFVQLFTEHYDEFAAECPIYEELRQLAQIVGLVKWMHQQGIEVDLRWVMRHSAPTYHSPIETDSVWAERLREKVGPKGLALSVSQFFGGVNLAASFQKGSWNEKDAERQRIVLEQIGSHRQAEAWSMPAEENRVRHAVVLPGCTRQSLGAYRTSATDLIVTLGELILPLRRNYNSLFNEPTEFGHGWTLSLPRVYARKPLPDEAAGAHTGGVPVLTLSDDAGSFEHVFIAPQRTLAGGTICYNGPRGSGIAELRVSPSRGGYSVAFATGPTWMFDDAGYLQKQVFGNGQVTYRYESPTGSACRLAEIACSSTTSQPIKLMLAYDNNGRICEAAGSDGSRVSYRYDAAGDLQEVLTKSGKETYAYNGDHQVTTIASGDKPVQTIAYNETGLVTELDAAGAKAQQFAYEETASGNALTEKTSGTRAEYDAQWCLRRLARPEGVSEYAYYQPGQLRAARHTTADGLVTDITVSPDERATDVRLPTGATYRVEKDASDRLTRLEVNGQPVAQYKYDQIKGRLQQETLPSMRVQRVYRAEELDRIIALPTRAGDGSQRVEVACRSGKPASLKGPDGLSVQYDFANGQISRVITPRSTVEITRDDGKTEWVWNTGRKLEWLRPQKDEPAKLIETVGPASREIQYSEGRPIQISDFDKSTTCFEWKNGLLASVADAYGSRISYEYEVVGDRQYLKSVRYPDGRQLAFTYDTAGRVIRIEE